MTDTNKLTQAEQNIVDSIMGEKVPTGLVRAEDARAALLKTGWKQWMEERQREKMRDWADVIGVSIDGTPIKNEKYTDEHAWAHLYDTYLRMAQMDQRSKYSFQVDNPALGRRIIDMTFDEYLADSVKHIDWCITTDIPNRLKFKSESPIGGSYYGITKEVAKFNTELLLRVKESIVRYSKLSEAEKLIRVSDAEVA